jgi:hypothetical protein
VDRWQGGGRGRIGTHIVLVKEEERGEGGTHFKGKWWKHGKEGRGQGLGSVFVWRREKEREGAWHRGERRGTAGTDPKPARAGGDTRLH